MKPPTKDWSSQHQSPTCKSCLFQTSGVLIQTPPRGKLLVRNQYSSWGVLWPTRYKDLRSLKSISSWEGWKVYPHHPLQTCQVGLLLNCPKFKMGSASQSYVQGHFHQHVSKLLSEKKKKSIKDLKASSVFPFGERVVNGNMINNYTNSKFPSPNTLKALQPLPPALSLWVFWFKFHCGIRLYCGLGFTSHFLFFWPWRVSAPELESTLSTLSCDIRLSSSSRWQCLETNKKSPVRSKSISRIPCSTPRDRDTCLGGATSKPTRWYNTKRKSLTNSDKIEAKKGWQAFKNQCCLINGKQRGSYYNCTVTFSFHSIF